jgi:hypothetical protein
VRRLLALAQSSNAHEAAAAAAKAQELMARHSIEEAELELEVNAAPEPVLDEDLGVIEGRRRPWREIIITALANANDCASYLSRKRNGVRVEMAQRLVGTSRAVGLVRYMNAYLTREVERLCDLEAAKRVDSWPADKRGAAMNKWRNSFKLGAAVEIARRIRRAWEEARVGANLNALARIDDTARRARQARDASITNTRKPHAATVGNSDAFRRGAVVGAGVDLSTDKPALPSSAAAALRSGA